MPEIISEEEIIKVQQAWGECLVHIGKLFLAKENYSNATQKLVEQFYGYNETTVMFKPTRACKKPFRFTAESAVSYYIGSNVEYSEDTGFALQPWISVKFENHGFILKKNHAISMGYYYFTDTQGKDKKVEFTLGFYRTKNGGLKINLHHSSLPFCMKRR